MPGSPRLPWELIDQIIANTINNPRHFFRRYNAEASELLKWTLVCQRTYIVAENYITDYCLYVDSYQSLRRFKRYLRGQRRRIGQCDDSGAIVTALHPITSLYLEVFADLADELVVARHFLDVCVEIDVSLRRLILDMPVRCTLACWEEVISTKLQRGLDCLRGLEECVSVCKDYCFPGMFWAGHDIFLDRPELAPWMGWPKLRRLALHDVRADKRFWAHVRMCSALETLVLAEARDIEHVCIKQAYLHPICDRASEAADGDITPARPLKVLLVECGAASGPVDLAGRMQWDEVDPENLVSVSTVDVPKVQNLDGNGKEICPDSLSCPEWVKARALEGTLWDWEGTPVQAGQ